MSWFSKFVFDPLKTLVERVIQIGEGDLKALAGLAASQLPASPITATAESAFEAAIAAAFDAAISSAVGSVPVVGAALAPEAVAEANKVVDYLTHKGATLVNDLATHAKDQLTALSGPATASALSGAATTAPAAQAAPTAV
jgi:hypothetical protein